MYTHFTKEEKGQRTLLFLHGWGISGSVFKPVVSRLAGFTSYLVDFWGFGQSSGIDDKEGWSVENFADNLYEFCIEQNLNNFSIVAHSFGCRVALVFCAKYPKMCQRLIITGGAGLRKSSFTRALKVKKYKIVKWLVARRLARPAVLNKYGSADFAALKSQAMKNTFVKVVNEDLSLYARCVKCPVLLVWGQNDTETPLWIAKKLNKLIPNSFLITIEGNHYAFLQNVNKFCGIVTAYLGENK